MYEKRNRVGGKNKYFIMEIIRSYNRNNKYEESLH